MKKHNWRELLAMEQKPKSCVKTDAQTLQDMLAYSSLLGYLAHGKITLKLIHDIGMSASSVDIRNSPFNDAYLAVRDKALATKDAILGQMTDADLERLKQHPLGDRFILEDLKIYKIMKKVDAFFYRRFFELPVEVINVHKKAYSEFFDTLINPAAFALYSNAEESDREKRWQQELDTSKAILMFGLINDQFKGHALDWNELYIYCNALTQHQGSAEWQIHQHLGYIFAAPHFISCHNRTRQEIALHQSGQTTEKQLSDAIYEHVQRLRNTEIKLNDCYTKAIYDDADMAKYNNEHEGLISKARERISRLLGYPPELRHSLYAELYLRTPMSSDDWTDSDDAMMCDFMALNAIKYREVLLAEGEEAADRSPLLAMQEPFKSQFQKKHE